MCQLEVLFESEKKKSRPEIQAVKIVDGRQKLIYGVCTKNRQVRSAQIKDKKTDSMTRDEKLIHGAGADSGRHEWKMQSNILQFDVNEVFRVDPTSNSTAAQSQSPFTPASTSGGANL